MPRVTFMNSRQRRWFDKSSMWNIANFPIAQTFVSQQRNMYDVLHIIFFDNKLTIQDMESLYIAIPPMREVVWDMMQIHTHNKVKTVVRGQINQHFLAEDCYNLITTLDRDEMDNTWSRCWRRWKLIIDAMDLTTNRLINLSAEMDQTELERACGCRPINWVDPAGIYQTKYQILTINFHIYGASLTCNDAETGEERESDMGHTFCGHVITKDAARLQTVIESVLEGPPPFMHNHCKVTFSIGECGDLHCNRRFSEHTSKMMGEFVEQGLLTVEDLAERECTIYNTTGAIVTPANQEKSVLCEQCMTIQDGYGQRQSSAVGVITARVITSADGMRWPYPSCPDYISAGSGFLIASRHHSTIPSTCNNKQIFRRGKLTFGDPFEYAYRLR